MSTTSSPATTISSISGTTPRVGSIRCYWSLVCPIFPNPGIPGSKMDLLFVHPDPVLAVHLASQKMSLMGRGILDFIHPAERDQARTDLANAIAADDLQGSVTRVRFARLTQIRRVLGAKEEDLQPPFDASTFVEDDEYLILDLVLNWVAEGLLLAFFHAIRDKDPVANNDPSKRDQEWTNYCGTASMGDDQIEALHRSVSVLPYTQTHLPPTRVFQIHTAAPLGSTLIFSWPPPRSGVGTHDGSYYAEEYSNLMRGVDMDPNQLSTSSGEMRTNCTTRFGARHSMTTEGVFRHITSVFIPYGNLIFSCFQTTKQLELQRSHALDSFVPDYPTIPEWTQNNWVEPQYGIAPVPYSQPSESYAESTFTFPQSHPSSSKSPGAARTEASSSRPLVRPPGDVQCCRICGILESPEWRRSESGIKDLCNACGLRLARQVAKREGRQKPRKKKEKVPSMPS